LNSYLPFQPERRALVDLEFKNRDADTVTDKELVEDRIRSLEMRLALHRLNIPKALKRKIDMMDIDPLETYQDDSFPPRSESGLEYPVCLRAKHNFTPKHKNISSMLENVLYRATSTCRRLSPHDESVIILAVRCHIRI
jgi:hypothetical protein